MSEGRELVIIEPHLRGNAGHYGEFVRAVAERAEGHFDRVVAHGGEGASALDLLRHPRVAVHDTFGSRSRTSEWRFLAQCLRDTSTRVLVLTARAVHAAFLESRVAMGGGSLHHVALYFHWRERSLLQRALQRVSRRVRAEALAIAPTPATAEFLRRAGWARVEEVPYPALPPDRVPEAGPPERLLMAGSLRMNKGLALVVDLNDRLRAAPLGVPMLVQTSGKRDGRHGSREARLLERLQAGAWDGLVLDASAPARASYEARFENALTLTPYDPAVFEDGVSGVALDALLRGSPVIATAGTWPARLVEASGAGVVMERWDAESLERAVRRAIGEWPTVRARAQECAMALARAHDPAHLVGVLAGAPAVGAGTF